MLQNKSWRARATTPPDAAQTHQEFGIRPVRILLTWLRSVAGSLQDTCETCSRSGFVSMAPQKVTRSGLQLVIGRGAIGRARSENRSTFVPNLMHEHLATGARQEMWAGQAAGSVTCGCGSVLSWAAPEEVSRLQWQMLEFALPGERAIRTRWHVAVRSALSKRIKRRDVVDGMMAC